MLDQVKPQHILNVIELSEKVKADKWYPRKKKLFDYLICFQDEVTKYLFSFCIYHCLFNPRWHSIDSSRYYSIKLSEVNQAIFLDFRKVLKKYENIRVTSRREQYLIQFFQKCDKVHFDFYSQLFDKTFHKDLPLVNVQENLDLDAVNISEAYTIEELKETFEELTYPITITTIDTLEADFIVHSVEASRTIQRRIVDGKLIIIKNKMLREEKVYNKFPEYTLCGYIYEVEKEDKGSGFKNVRKGKKRAVHRFVPIDIFPNFRLYNNYFNTSNAISDLAYSARINTLNEYLATTCTNTVRDSLVGFAESPEDVAGEILKLMTGKNYAYLLLSDENSAKTGNSKYIECRSVEAIIEDYWIDDGEVLGFMCWFNGALREVQFNFSGENNRLLNSFKDLKRKVVKIFVVDIGSTRYYYGAEVMWDVKPYMVRPLRSTGVMVEKCPLCASTDYAPDVRGICRYCCQNMKYYEKTFGFNVWIPAGHMKEKKRKETLWEPQLANAVKYRYKGHLLVTREDGQWMLKEDEEAMSEYKSWLETHASYTGKKKRKKKRRKKSK